jgi:hypothetical protein
VRPQDLLGRLSGNRIGEHLGKGDASIDRVGRTMRGPDLTGCHIAQLARLRLRLPGMTGLVPLSRKVLRRLLAS